MKKCAKCETEKPFTDFYKNNQKKGNKRLECVGSYCKMCADYLRAKHKKVKKPHKKITHIECSCCKRIKEANRENFTINKTYVSGFNTRCKVCIKIKHTKYQKHARSYLTDQYVIQCIKSELKNMD